MKILCAEVTNFGSYKHLRFEFDKVGLALVYGPTGAGKSTLMDIIPWVLFGTTAKNGAADDIRSWQAEEFTKGNLKFELSGRTYVVTRIRGSSGKNDLYWSEYQNGHSDVLDTDAKLRGKDLIDTQKLLEARLAVDADTYLSSAYFHEFSQTSSFFTASAKARRELFEGIADLELPKRLGENCSVQRKELKSQLEDTRSDYSRLQGMQMQLESSKDQAQEACQKWIKTQEAKIQDLKSKADSFDFDRAAKSMAIISQVTKWDEDHFAQVDALVHRIEQMEPKVKSSKQLDLEEAHIRNKARCSQCGSLPENINEALREHQEIKFNNNRYIADVKLAKADLKRLVDQVNPYSQQLITLKKDTNVYFEQYKDTKKQENPFLTQVENYKLQITNHNLKLKELNSGVLALEYRVNALTQLQDLSGQLRTQLLKRAIHSIECETNRVLEKHFDGEFRVGFSADDSDNLTVTIHKSGHECNYRQLSKGQRQMLKLSFGLAVMDAAANQAGTHFNVVMLDEPTDGCDEVLKTKSHALFQELTMKHDTVLVIDHSSELRALFDKKFKVTLEGDYSTVQDSYE